MTALEGRALGVHVAYAPILDVNNNPANPVINTRSYGEDPALAARLGAAFVRGLQEHGMIATGKHFPGHGDTEVNSHLALPVVGVTRARLDTVELVPFRASVAAGIGAIGSRLHASARFQRSNWHAVGRVLATCFAVSSTSKVRNSDARICVGSSTSMAVEGHRRGGAGTTC